MPIARKGKIARFPLIIREEVNRRLLNGEGGPKIIRWLNEQPDVLRVLDEHFGEEPVTSQNLSEWRTGTKERPSGYEEWLERRERIENIKSLATFAAKMGEAAGGSLTDGSSAILGSKILEKLEAGELTPEEMADISKALVALRSTDLEARKAGQRDRLLAQKERQVSLSEKVFQVRTCEAYAKWYDDKRAREILEGKGNQQVKMEKLRQLMFPMDEPLDPRPLNST